MPGLTDDPPEQDRPAPTPPGVPTIFPGERFNEAVVTYLRTGKAAGMTIPGRFGACTGLGPS